MAGAPPVILRGPIRTLISHFHAIRIMEKSGEVGRPTHLSINDTMVPRAISAINHAIPEVVQGLEQVGDGLLALVRTGHLPPLVAGLRAGFPSGMPGTARSTELVRDIDHP